MQRLKHEAALNNCNTIAQLRKAGELFKQNIAKSLESTIILLSNVICCLELKGKKFEVYEVLQMMKFSNSRRFFNK